MSDLPFTMAIVVRLAFMALGVWVLVRGFRTYLRRRREPDSSERRSFIRSWHTLGCGAAVFLVSAVVMVLRHQWHGPQWIHQLAAVVMFVGTGIGLVGGAWVGWTSIDTRYAGVPLNKHGAGSGFNSREVELYPTEKSPQIDRDPNENPK